MLVEVTQKIIATYRSLIRKQSPGVGTRIEEQWETITTGLLVIIHHYLFNLHLDVSKCLERDESDLILETVSLQVKAFSRKEHIRVSSGRQIGDAVTDEDY